MWKFMAEETVVQVMERILIMRCLIQWQEQLCHKADPPPATPYTQTSCTSIPRKPRCPSIRLKRPRAAHQAVFGLEDVPPLPSVSTSIQPTSHPPTQINSILEWLIWLDVFPRPILTLVNSITIATKSNNSNFKNPVACELVGAEGTEK